MRVSLAMLAVVGCAAGANAQDSARTDTTRIGSVLSIGNTAGVNGLRLNFRDSRLVRVNGINLTVWLPDGAGRGEINGLALGVPATGGRIINGVGIAVGGFAVSRDVNGLLIAGLGSGIGGSVTGIAVAGLGVAAREGLAGIDVAGLAVASGGRLDGIAAAGLAAVAVGDVKGLLIGGLAAGTSGTIHGVAIAGGAAGAPMVRGLLLAGLAAGGQDVNGVMIAPVYTRIVGGQLTGGTIGAVNDVRGELHGVSIGIFNYARSLHGVQLGLLNFAGNNHGLARLLPLLNLHL